MEKKDFKKLTQRRKWLSLASFSNGLRQDTSIYSILTDKDCEMEKKGFKKHTAKQKWLYLGNLL